jgi:hypothetical protein
MSAKTDRCTRGLLVDWQTAKRIWNEVGGTRGCAHPIRLTGTQLNHATGEIRTVSVRVACRDRRAVICPSCSYLYKADAYILVSAGLMGGKGIGADIQSHPRLFVSLTAPSFGAVHSVDPSGRCRPRGHAQHCVHRLPEWCNKHHADDDPVLGTPLCDDCFDYEGAILWNAAASKLWNRTVVRLRERVASTQRLTTQQAKSVARLNYLKVAEFQRRGLVHFHVVVRGDGPIGPSSDPPSWLTGELIAHELGALLREVETVTRLGTRIRWGSQFDIKDFSRVGDESRRVANYVAKYATKTTDGSMGFARRFTKRSQIAHAHVGAHARRMALTAWDLGGLPELESLNLKDHAHSFGFTGQLITKSRAFSTTFGDLRAIRASFRVNVLEEDPVSGSYIYDGRGYSDPRAEAVAELFHGMTVELHQEARQRRLDLPQGRDAEV